MFNPIIATLHNPLTGRYHPLVLVESPLPGPPEPGKPVRHKSHGHHTTGFATREESDQYADATYRPIAEGRSISGTCAMKPDVVIEVAWTDPEVPAVVHFFGDVLR